MDIKLKDYRRGAEIKLTLKDVPATMMPRAIDLFAMLLDEATEKQNAEPKQALYVYGEASVESVNWPGTEDTPRECGHDHTPNAETVAAMEEVVAKRKRRTKAEMAADLAASSATVKAVIEHSEKAAEQANVDMATYAEGLMKGASDEPGLPLDDSTPKLATPAPTEVAGESAATTEPSVETASSEQPEITDSELQRYSAKLAQHFGAPQKVFDIAAKFVPDGAVPRPTNIRDNSQRWAFVNAAHAETGLAFHG